MGKAEFNKKTKRASLLQTGLELFTNQGVSKTSVSDISKKAGLAKGTFYLYFHDKYDLRDQLVAKKSGEILLQAQNYLMQNPPAEKDLEGYLTAMADYVLFYLNENKQTLRFISKNLTWGLFRHEYEESTESGSLFREVYDAFLSEMDEAGVTCENPEFMLFTILELINATGTSCILYETPAPLEEYLPYLHVGIHQLIEGYTQKKTAPPPESDES